jgi:transposase
MLTVETIRKIRLARHREGKSIREIAKELNLSKNTVKKALRSKATEFCYRRKNQPRPKLGAFVEILEKKLKEDEVHPVKLRRTAQILFEEIQAEGYRGAYDSVQRFVKAWQEERHILSRQAFIPLSFAPGEAFQFDWSHEQVEIDGMPATVKVAHIRLCYSRLCLCIAYPRESQEMVFDAHERAAAFFGGMCKRGIYDNMRTAVTKILRGKQRDFNRRFEQMCSHYLFEPVACTPASGWEKGQVENQVGVIRRRFFVPRPKFQSLADLNEYLMGQCLAWAKSHRRPEIKDKTIWQVFEEEKPFLVGVSHPFDGYSELPAKVSSTSLVSFDRNCYSVSCTEAGRAVEVRAYATKVVIVSRGTVVGDHERRFGRDKTVFNPWHYLPALERKPGALRNGAPFKDWALPDSLREIRTFLERFPDGDRQFVGILSAVAAHGTDAVERACEEALKSGAASKDVVLNLLSRQGEVKAPVLLLPKLRLKEDPTADCNRYDCLLREVDRVAK